MIPEQPTSQYPKYPLGQSGGQTQPTAAANPTSNHPTLSAIAQSISGMVRDYPGPSMLIGAGLAWMVISREQRKSLSMPLRLRNKAIHGKDQLQGAAEDAKEHILDAATDLREAAHKAKEQTLDRLGEVKHSAEEHLDSAKESLHDRAEEARASLHDRAESARETYDSILEDNPLVLGAVAIAVGLAVGLLVPPTQKEDLMMGPTRDHLLDQARSIVDNARQAAAESLRSGAGSVKAHLSAAAEDAKTSLSESVESAKAAVKEDLASDSAAVESSGQIQSSFTPSNDFDPSDTA